MSSEQLKNDLRKIYSKALRLDIVPGNIPDNDLINTLGIDSISSLEVLVWIENEFDIIIEDEDLSPDLIDSLDVISNYVTKQLQNGESS